MSLISIDWKPNHRKLRQFGLVFGPGILLTGGLLAWSTGFFQRSPLILSAGLGLLAGMVIMGALVRPSWLRPLYLAWMGAAFPIGWILSHLLLSIIFLLIFTPLGLLFKMLGRDPLRLRSRGAGAGYWVSRPETRRAEDYFRQF